MEMKSFSFISKSDGLAISAMYVKPNQEIRAILQIVHGMAEHKERYIPLMETMAKLGFLCVAADLRGHGKSVKSMDDLGFFYDTSGAFFIEDAHQLTLLLRTSIPNKPLILFGHSMGSLLVRAYAKNYDQDIDGLIICGSPSKNIMAKPAGVLVQIMKKMKGEHHRSHLIQKLTFGTYAKKFSERNSENCWLSENEENVRLYDGDPLCGFIFTLNGFENLFHLIVEVYDEKGWKVLHPKLPILFIAGSDDPCIIDEKRFREAYECMEEIGYRQVDHTLIPGKRHEILNESNKEETFQILYHWISDKIF